MIKQLIRAILPVIILTVGITVLAQPEEPVVNPQDIFAEGIIWTPAEADVSPPTAKVNFEKKMIEVFDGNTWRSYPYPPDADSVSDAALRPDGIVEIVLEFMEMKLDPLPEDVWLLDPQTGDYSRPPTVCEARVLTASPGEWVTVYVDEERTFLCHSGTGEMREIPLKEFDNWEVFSSPDGAYLVLIGRDWNSNGGDFVTFAYKVDTEEATPLGYISRNLDNRVKLCNWVSDTQGVLCSADFYRSWPGSSYYVFDVTQSDSLIHAFGGWEEDIMWIDDPPRYVSLFSQNRSSSITGSSGPDHISCTLSIYDAKQLINREVGYECLPIPLDYESAAPYYRHGDVIYYLTIEGPDATVSTLHFGDVKMNMFFSIFTAEIETILSVSPDGRYVVLLLDDDRVFDFIWNSPANNNCCPEDEAYEVAILDTQSNEFVYRSEPIGVYLTKQVAWLNEQSVVIAATRVFHSIRVSESDDTFDVMIPPSLRRVTVNDDSIVDVVIETSLSFDHYDFFSLNTSPDHRYSLRSDHTVIDLYNFEVIPLLCEGCEETFQGFTRWTPEGTIEASIYGDYPYQYYYLTLP